MMNHTALHDEYVAAGLIIDGVNADGSPNFVGRTTEVHTKNPVTNDTVRVNRRVNKRLSEQHPQVREKADDVLRKHLGRGAM